MPDAGVVTKEKLVSDFRKLGIVEGDMLNLKISLKSIGKVEGGADTVIEALLEVVGDEGTLVTDSFVDPYPAFLRFKYKNRISSGESTSYAGAITNAIMKKKDVYRADHPIQRFAAIGKRAKELTESFTKDSEPYSFARTMAEMGAKNLRVGGKDKVVGVGTTHVAICELKLKQKIIKKGIYYKDKDGQIKFFVMDWANGCPVGFNNLIDKFRENGKILAEGMVGNTESMITSMKDTLDFERELLKKDPGAFLCSDPTCHFCSFAWKASKYSFCQACRAAVKRKNFKKLAMFLLIGLIGKEYPED